MDNPRAESGIEPTKTNPQPPRKASTLREPWLWLSILAVGAIGVSLYQGWDWLIPAVSAVVAAIGVWLSKPDNKAWAWVSFVLILITGAWQARNEYVAGRTRVELRRRVYQNLAIETAGFAEHLSILVVRSSDGWLPKSDRELFSERTARMVCSELDVTKDAPVFPKTTVLQWAASTNQSFGSAIHRALTEDSESLDADLAKILSKVERSAYLGFATARLQLASFDKEVVVERPPLMCWGLEPVAAESFSDFLTLMVRLRNQRESLEFEWPEEDWLKFPDHYRQQFLGIDRFSPEALREWQAKHPNNPGPALYGKGDPNKR